jgi:hypothetical protein
LVLVAPPRNRVSLPRSSSDWPGHEQEEITMKRLIWGLAGLLVVGSTVVGCAHMPRWAGGGWTTLVDDAAGNVEPVGLQGSHVLSGLADADGLLDLPPEATWEAGRRVPVLLFPR